MRTKRCASKRVGASAASFVLALGLAVSGTGVAHPITSGFQTNFDVEAPGPLPGTNPTDSWEIKSGAWTVEDQSMSDTPTAGANRVLVQQSRAAVPNEPMLFVRGRVFRTFTAEVTAAIMDSQTALGDLPPGVSVGMVFRAPVTEGVADKDNLYLFSAVVTGINGDFPTGKIYALWKRIGRGYFLLSTKMAPTWADLSKPHRYKVVVAGGRIQAFVDGRMVIDHTDVPSGDTPTAADPFPGLPYDSGAVGLRTSGTRAWFDNFTVVGDGAYEGRANAGDVYASHGENGQVRRGTSMQATQELDRYRADAADTGYQYSEDDFEEAKVTSLDNPGGGSPSAGATLRTFASRGKVTSEVRLAGVSVAFADPSQKVVVSIGAQSLETVASATCTATASAVNLQNASISILLSNPGQGVPDTVIGPIPLRESYQPNTVIFDQPGYVSIVAHARSATSEPKRVDVAALKIVIAGAGVMIPAQNLPVPNGRTSAVSMPSPALEFTLGQAVAGRYCA
ncbi:MAG: family 16 glycoside hydrolase [Actinomycetota bacterium]